MQQLIALWRIAQPPVLLMLGVAALLLAETAATLTIPWVGGRFAEQLVETPDAASYRQFLALWLGLLLTQSLLRFVSSYLLGSAGASVTARIRSRIYDHLQALPLSYHHNRDAGDMLSLLARDASITGHFFTTTLPGLAPQALTLAGAWILMAMLDLTIALLIGCTVPLAVVGLRLLLRRIRPLATQLADAHGTHMAVVEENLRLLNLLKAFGREERESARIQQQNTQILSLERNHLLAMSLLNPAIQAAGAFLLVLLLWFSAERLTGGELNIGQVVSLLLYGLLLSRPASQLASAAGSLQSSRGAASRIETLLSEPAESYGLGHEAPPLHPGRLTFEEISFGYPGQSPVLDRFSLSVTEGETLAITGPNGAGKSTLIHLLMRFHDPNAGRILMDDHDIHDLRLSTLRGLIGLVPQTVTLLNDSIRANICFGVAVADDDAIIQALSLAQAQDIIDASPDGLDSRIGPDGIRLSGGQRQRLALARALLRGCPILVLDEATSMFDPAALKHFVHEFKQRSDQHTVILITHQPENLELADRVITLPKERNAPSSRAPRNSVRKQPHSEP